MDLTPTEEQHMLRESVARFLRQTYTADVRRKIRTGSQDVDRALWNKFAELGWLAMPLPEAHGGLGNSAVEVGAVMEEFGRHLVSAPYLSTVILGAGLVAALGNQEQQTAILPAVASGHCLLAFAHSEQQAGADLAAVETSATRAPGGWRLRGTKTIVLDAPSADHLVVSARINGEPGARHGLGLFLVEPSLQGVKMEPYPRLGGGLGATLTFNEVIVSDRDHLGGSDDALPVIEAQVDRALAASCAEAVGMMAALLEATTEYTKMREQFGHPLSFNQVVRHRLADMAIALEEARSLALRAALMLDAGRPERIRAVSGAKAKIGRGARLVAEQAVQLHGAMGFTDELEIGAFFKRVLAFEVLFGGVDHHLSRHAAASNRLSLKAA